jgi:hypothetical protein
MSIIRSEWCLQQWTILLVTHPDIDSGMHQAAQRKRRQSLMRQHHTGTYYPRPSRPENDLLISSSFKAYMQAQMQNQMERGDIPSDVVLGRKWEILAITAEQFEQ